jgi:hypothetical protein
MSKITLKDVTRARDSLLTDLSLFPRIIILLINLRAPSFSSRELFLYKQERNFPTDYIDIKGKQITRLTLAIVS